MSREASKIETIRAGLLAGCERLVHPSAADSQERERQLRLVAVLLVSPFVAALAVAQMVAPISGIASTMAAVCVLLGFCSCLLLVLASTGRGRLVEGLTLAGSLALLGCLVAGFGGAASPALAIGLAIPFETRWITRSRGASFLAAGMVLAVAALAAAGAWVANPPTPSVWHWLAPLLYLGLVAARQANAASPDHLMPAPAPARLPVERLSLAILRMNQQGEIVETSARTSEVLGLAPDLLLGSGLFDRLQVGDRVAFLCAVSAARETGANQTAHLRIRRPMEPDGSCDAHYHDYEAEILADSADTGDLLIAIRDASKLAELHGKLADAMERVDSTEIAKGRFLAAVSHELRTPLNAIIGFSDILLHEPISGPLEAKQAEQISLIREAGHHLLGVVNAILDVSKIEAGAYQITPEAFVLKDAVDLSCSMMAPQALERGVTIAASIPDTVGEVLGDQRAVQQILLNLLSNAVKFTPQGGNIRVAASRRGELVQFRVTDNGIGIEDKDLERLGSPFVQVQNDYTRQFQGTGLGLSLVKGLVRLHKGELTIESAPGLGTEVTVTLPNNRSDAARETTPARDEIEMQMEEIDGETLRKIA